jgi:hypothetical protein
MCLIRSVKLALAGLLLALAMARDTQSLWW